MFECQTKVRKILATLAHAPKDQVHVIAETYEGVTYDVDDASQCGGGEMNDVWDFTSESSDYEAYGTYGALRSTRHDSSRTLNMCPGY